MGFDYSVFNDVPGALPKHKPGVLVRKAKQRTEAKKWRATKKAVDQRQRDPHADDQAPRCFITGVRLQVSNSLDEWSFRDPCHIEARSKSKLRKFEVENVIACSRGVHRLIDSNALLLFDKRGRKARSEQAIDHVAWNRRLVPKGQETCRIRKGLAVVELEDVRD